MSKPNANVIHAAHPSGAWYTPESIRELAQAVLANRIDLDPCTHVRNPLGATIHYSIRNTARKHDWAAEVLCEVRRNGHSAAHLWMNPPFGRGIGWWLDTWHETIDRLAAERVPVRALLLVPSRIETRWFEEAAWDKAQLDCTIRGRLRFERYERGRFKRGWPARWPCSLLYYGCDRTRAREWLRKVGRVRSARPWHGPQLREVDSRQVVIPFPAADALSR